MLKTTTPHQTAGLSFADRRRIRTSGSIPGSPLGSHLDGHDRNPRSVAKLKTGIVATANGKPKLVCDRCDGAHETELCPHFKKSREKHPDATGRGKFLKLSTPGEAKHTKAAKVKRQPADGSCLFHSISGGVNEPALNARTLRAKVCDFIVQNSDCTIAGNPLKDWIAWETGGRSVRQYATRMANKRTWGGGIEMACISIMLNVNVHVWEKDGKRGGYERISCFDRRRAKKTANVLYRGGVHFDQLIVSERSSGSTTPPLIPRSRRSNTPTQSPRRSTGGGRSITPTPPTLRRRPGADRSPRASSSSASIRRDLNRSTCDSSSRLRRGVSPLDPP